jgi:fatty-acid desaturase
MEVVQPMKKFFTLIAAIVMATTLSMPAFAATKKHKKHHAAAQSHSKKHTKNAKKKGTTKGQKKGQ